jgi:regulator of RNase E activity RraA
MFPELPAVVGYAVTARVRTAVPPMEGGRYSYWRGDWWKKILTIPEPRIVVLQDIGRPPGVGAFVGEVYANILKALGCTAVLTNGAVRDLPQARSISFQMFAGNISVSHAYAHLFDMGETVKIGNLEVQPGELLLGDLHGVVSIPFEIAARVPAAARGILERRQHLIKLCRAKGFTLDRLEEGRRELGIMETRERDMQDDNLGRGKS